MRISCCAILIKNLKGMRAASCGSREAYDACLVSDSGAYCCYSNIIEICIDVTLQENGLLFVPKGQAQNAQAQMFSDPNMAMDMMKKNLSMIIPQTLTFAWVNFFFSGFVAAKIPFPLTQRFRSMLQNGIDYSTIDVSYVSSRSWYFLNMFGLRGLFSLILGEENG
ncbi:ER membrane protein complex subunit 3-like [Camellia sinensis]|uniref:ER membrane protein complex subunit 3-like n=1 Tax=Camellia sinensis TaxID=4442 RepID=UPI0010369D8C|nr:ER membrane protein complex subunit 3-like [Camellia sinensis]